MNSLHLRDLIEELVGDHYSDVEIQNLLKRKSIVAGIAYIKKVRDDMYSPMGSEYDFAGDRPSE